MTTVLEVARTTGLTGTQDEYQASASNFQRVLEKALKDQKYFKFPSGGLELPKTGKSFGTEDLKIGILGTVDESQSSSFSAEFKNWEAKIEHMIDNVQSSSKSTTKTSIYMELTTLLSPLVAKQTVYYEMAYDEWLFLKKTTWTTCDPAVIALIDEVIPELESSFRLTQPKIDEIVEEISAIVNNFHEILTSLAADNEDSTEEAQELDAQARSTSNIKRQLEPANIDATTVTIENQWQRFQNSVEDFKIMWDIWCNFTHGLNELIYMKRLLEPRRNPPSLLLKQSKTI
ncbi:hypothetical protein AA313_de0202615 [Arthrobotrys entomopaga]|nr:hypothetical protein AA313_de0202615 [Arthrobotrys entomopaga]